MMRLLQFMISVLFIALFSSCTAQNGSGEDYIEPEILTAEQRQQLETAVFAGGCFWCTEAVFERVQGVVKVVSGYSGGKESTADYDKVSRGETDHAESIQIWYDPEVVEYETLVDIFLGGAHDPTQLNRQGPDVGKQYRSAIFYDSKEQRRIAQKVIERFESENVYNDPIVTKVVPLEEFYKAEEYHQNYYRLHPDAGYIQRVSKPKVEKFMKKYPDWLKEEYRVTEH